MPSYDALLRDLRGAIPEIDVQGLAGASARPAIIDCREADEHAQGAIPGAVWIPRGFLEARIEKHVADRAAPIVVYCASGNRSLFAVRTLAELGYTNVALARRRVHAWKRAGLPWEMPARCGAEQETRYSRHVLLPEVGVAGQQKLLARRSLCIGAGGLGSPSRCTSRRRASARSASSMTTSSTPRTSSARSCTAPTGSARRRSRAPSDAEEPQPRREVEKHRARLDVGERDRSARPYDVIIDGADNFATRYLVNDVALLLGKPVVHASIFRFEGQLTVFPANGSPCYRCLYPEPPPPEDAPSCAEGGVLGVLPGIIGVLQATEAIKLILGIGETLAGRLLVYDALAHEVPRAQAAPRSEVSDVRRRRRSLGDPADRLRAVLRAR